MKPVLVVMLSSVFVVCGGCATAVNPSAPKGSDVTGKVGGRVT